MAASVCHNGQSGQNESWLWFYFDFIGQLITAVIYGFRNKLESFPWQAFPA
jgi:hypothetical protein